MNKLMLSKLLITVILFSMPVLVRSETLYKLSEIVVQTEKEAVAIINLLNKGTAFSEKALKRHNISILVEDLGWHYLDKMALKYSVLSKLKKGEFTQKPLNYLARYQVVKVVDVKDQDKPSLKSTEFVFVNSVAQYLPKGTHLTRDKRKPTYKSRNNDIELEIENTKKSKVESASMHIKLSDKKITRKTIDKVLPIIQGFIMGSDPSLSAEKAELLSLDLVSSVARLNRRAIISGLQFSTINYSLGIIKEHKKKKRYILINLHADNMNSVRGQVYSALMKKHNSKLNRAYYLAKISGIFP